MTHLPRKRFGQHFLCDQAIIHQIIASLAPRKDEHLVEIGPGQGALTLPILKEVKTLEAIELDRDLIAHLEARQYRDQHLKIYQADALTFDFAQLKQDERMLRVFGNLPYNISTPLIFHLLEYTPIIQDMLFMLQKEVAQRLAAKPNEEHYGRLSVMTQYACDMELLFDVPASAFYPPPQVTSSIIQLIPFRQPPHQALNFANFAALVKQAFGQRRKTLRNSLKGLVSDEMWATINVPSDARAENLSVKDFVEMSNALRQI